MLRWAVLFFVIALISALFGFGAIAGIAWDAAKILCVIFLILAVFSLIFGGRSPRDAV